ncbi:hypothetical protein TgHK011_010069 [Trichoderma gracile]|nr:hypothetical protein TgHK011_010069 [Trichoderma gracile]
MAHISILSVLLMLWLAGRAAADGGDDFANNLASDLGPIIALFGERVVMQFMSQAMGIADCILLAVAPIGAITVVVSAIRVAGPTWLKSFIGRARENVAAAEVEVMSSTSNEACELWNGHSVVRCPGSADIYQFICLLPTQHNLKSLSRTQARVQCSKLEKEGDDMYLIPIENDLSPKFQIHRRVRRKELEYIDGGKQDDLLWKIETSGPGYAWRSFMKIPERLSSRIEDIFRQLASYHTSALPLIRRRTRVSPRGLDLEAASHQDQSSISTQLEIDTPESRKVSSRMSRLRFLSSRPSDKPDSNKSRLDEVKEIDEGEQDKDIIVIVDRSDDSAPNLLLNCHDRVQRGEIYLAAAFGVFLQLGALVFFGFITYDPPTKGQFFLKDGKRIVAYAFPCAAGGTVLLVLGLFICAWVVEMSTTETCYEAPNHHMFVVWLQKGRTKRDDKWRVKDGELEAVLSLWLYSTQGEFADIDLSPNLRLYGQSHLWARLSRDFAWWMPETLPPITRRSGADITRALAHPERVVVGFMSEREDGMEEPDRSDGLTTVSESEDGMEELGRSDGLTTASEPEYLVLESTDKTERIFARDLLFSFIRAVAKRPDVTIEVGGRESPNTEAWQQGNMMQLRADPISILARKLEKLGLGTLSDIHFDLIVPFILEGKTGAKDVIDDKIKQAQQYELSRQWKKLVEICSSLLELAQKFDMEKEASGPLAVAACLEFLSRLHHEADLQRQEGRSEEELMTQLRFLEEAFIYAEEQLECSGVLPGLQYSLAESRGGYATTFDMLIGATPDATKEFPESFNIANEHRELMRASNSWERLSWAGEELGKIDSFGWSPLHYAANWQLDHVRIDIWESGDVVSLPDLMGRTPLHHACLKGNEKAVNLLLDRDALIEVAGHDGTTPIHCAVLSGNLNILKKLVEEVRSKRLKHTRESIPHVDRNKRHPIHWAAAQGCIEVVRLLRDDIVRTDRYGWACIHLAVIYKHRPLLEYIIKELSGDVNLRDNQSRTPLHLAVEFQSWKAFDVLIRAGADVKVKDRVGLTPLHKAVGQMEMAETGRTQMDIAERLIERHADVNATDTEGRTALLLAAENGMADVADFLIGHGADVSIATKDKRTALHMATKSKPITEKLLNHGADIHAKNIKGYTPLYLAVMDGIAEVAALLIDKGADVTTVAEDGRTPLHLAVRSKDITEKLLTYGADINAKDIEGYTPLYLAITEGTAKVAALLIDRGADVAIAEEDGRTPLHMALSRGEDGLEIAKKLLNFDPIVEGHNPYVNTTAEGDATPLHVAAEYGPLEAVKMLLHLGADKDQADGYGQTALLIAMYQENWDIAEELLKAGADIRADSRVGYTPLLGAVMGKQERIVEQLLRMGADVNAVDEDGYSAIHLAVSGGDPGIFGRLLRAGATIDAVTKFSSQTPLHIAVRNGDRRMVQILLENGADTKPLNRLEFTPLQYALFRGDLVIVEEFVEHDKSSDFTAPKAVLQKGENGDTPLHTLCRYSLVQGHEYQRCEMLEKLLSIRPHGDMINAKNDEGLTPLDLAFFSFHEHPDFIRMLILSGAMGSHMVETETEESLFSSSSWDDEQGMP